MREKLHNWSTVACAEHLLVLSYNNLLFVSIEKERDRDREMIDQKQSISIKQIERIEYCV
ncbi:hypothetical protein DFA_11823 [Cavenderia fasciculata]|uniref:Uncharacterized protein n=1 Tax=Cavenderia fasciculata TaxID=261658 RepID=F4QEB3_CACFS|nr:uncharacterized protein DFA_11823 [Cavenderia fasciculata]EGG14060.1 hypothetical protein DFA_11823 [Cavenderia fasciculata]|eukprot:XP_004350768.1 hypothetical protein DFA_11823 [Cavenderia fasciculata]